MYVRMLHFMDVLNGCEQVRVCMRAGKSCKMCLFVHACMCVRVLHMSDLYVCLHVFVCMHLIVCAYLHIPKCECVVACVYVCDYVRLSFPIYLCTGDDGYGGIINSVS